MKKYILISIIAGIALILAKLINDYAGEGWLEVYTAWIVFTVLSPVAYAVGRAIGRDMGIWR